MREVKLGNVQAVRTPDEDDKAAFDDSQMSYYKKDGIWWLYVPGCGLANLINHQITENFDSTITVSPSILLTGHHSGQITQVHGHLENGRWRDA